MPWAVLSGQLIHDRTEWLSVCEKTSQNGDTMRDERAADEALPTAPAPSGSYVPAVVQDGLAFSAGMTPRAEGQLVIRGRVGQDVDVDAARQAAGLAARNALAAVAEAVGGLAQVQRCLRLTVFVACTDDFTDLSPVADGASAALTGLLGERGVPVRSAIGVRSLPSGAPVEVELTAAVSPRDRGDQSRRPR